MDRIGKEIVRGTAALLYAVATLLEAKIGLLIADVGLLIFRFPGAERRPCGNQRSFIWMGALGRHTKKSAIPDQQSAIIDNQSRASPALDVLVSGQR
jgi:hypothetical protein